MHIGIDGMLLSGSFSGVEKYILNLCRNLTAFNEDIEATVFVPRGFRDKLLKKTSNITVSRALISGRIRTLRIIWEQMWLPFKLFSYGFDLFHFPGYIHPVIKGIPTVLTIHDLIAITAPNLCKRSNMHYYQKFLKKSIDRATRIIVPSRVVRDDIWKEFKKPKASMDIIPMGTDIRSPEKPVEGIREKYGIGENPYLLYVGNIEPKKGLSSLIKAFFAAFMYKSLPCQLVIAGKREWKSKSILKMPFKLGPAFSKQVIFTGYVDEGDLPVLYSEAELFVFPSMLEGFGIPPLEAMACGTPVLLSSEPALRETYNGYAHFFKIGNIKDLREKIEQLLENKDERGKYLTKGKELSASLSWRQCASNTIESYQTALQDFRRTEGKKA